MAPVMSGFTGTKPFATLPEEEELLTGEVDHTGAGQMGRRAGAAEASAGAGTGA
jgi:hypothetical protein